MPGILPPRLAAVDPATLFPQHGRRLQKLGLCHVLDGEGYSSLTRNHTTRNQLIHLRDTLPAVASLLVHLPCPGTRDTSQGGDNVWGEVRFWL